MKTSVVLRAACAALLAFGSTLTAQTSFTTRNVRPGGNFLWSIASGPAGLVAVGDAGTILSSPSGAAWTRRTSGTTDWLVGVTYGAGQYVAVGDHGRVLVSTDGAAWTNVSQTATTARLNNVIFGGGIFVAVGEVGTIITSTDARTWTARSSGVTTWLRGLAFVPTSASQPPTFINNDPYQFYASGQDGTVRGSFDGVTWSHAFSGFSFAPGAVLTQDIEALSSTPLAGIGADGTVIVAEPYSDVGQSPVAPNPAGGFSTQVVTGHWWLLGSTKINARFRGIVHGANALFAVGENGIIAAAPYGTAPWTPLDSGTTASLTGGLYVGNSLFVVGENETILQSTPLYYSRLLNLSTRGQVGTGENSLISGFVVSGTAAKKVLLRAAGPALTGFGVSGALARPVLSVYDGANHVIASNTGWGTNPDPAAIANAAAQTGAFAFAAQSADSAVLLTLDPGSYTLQVTGANASGGTALVETYDADGLANNASRAIDISTRGSVTANAPLIAGFNIGGTASRRVLVRGVGPSLTGFGVTGALAEPRLTIYDATGSRYSYVDAAGSFVILDSTFLAGSWSARTNADQVRGAAYSVGAFALTEDSKDAVLLAPLPPGSYTAVVTGLNNAAGVALVEVYDLP